MLNNDKYFNQSIITSENIQNRLSQFVEGLDINTIVELINKDIEQNHPQRRKLLLEISKRKITKLNMSVILFNGMHYLFAINGQK